MSLRSRLVLGTIVLAAVGLGLSIVAAVARAHGGTVTARSEPQHGATFRIDLPAAPLS
jgi:two-component system OmpR family sensor kinase